jgi:hypothetical protein
MKNIPSLDNISHFFNRLHHLETKPPELGIDMENEQRRVTQEILCLQ